MTAFQEMASPSTVRFSGLAEQFYALKDPLNAAIQKVLSASRFIGGSESEELEHWFADYCGVRHAVGVASGTVAIELALRACGIGRGDDVITVPNTFIATVAAIVAVGARPIFVDADERTGSIDARKLDSALTPRVKAIVPVHLYGLPAPMDELDSLARARGIMVVEDAAQAHGARYRGKRVGSMGRAGCFSFYPTKNLGAFGDGGMITTDNDDLANTLGLLRDHGRSSKYEHSLLGVTGRLDNLQAAVLRVQADYLDDWNARRRRAAGWYRQTLPKQVKPLADPNGESVYHLFVVRVTRRDEFRAHLMRYGIETGIHYPVPLHLQKACSFLGYRPGDFLVSESLAREIVSLPMHPYLSEQQVARVAQAASEFFR